MGGFSREGMVGIRRLNGEQQQRQYFAFFKTSNLKTHVRRRAPRWPEMALLPGAHRLAFDATFTTVANVRYVCNGLLCSVIIAFQNKLTMHSLVCSNFEEETSIGHRQTTTT